MSFRAQRNTLYILYCKNGVDYNAAVDIHQAANTLVGVDGALSREREGVQERSLGPLATCPAVSILNIF